MPAMEALKPLIAGMARSYNSYDYDTKSHIPTCQYQLNRGKSK